jgi:hypothetical protein
MSSALALVGKGMIHSGPDHRTPSIIGALIADNATAFGVGAGLGEVCVRYHDKWYGKHAPEILGGVGGVVGALLKAYVGDGFFANLFSTAGLVGSGAAGLDLGLEHARKDMGFVTVKVAAGTDVRKLKRGDKVSGESIGHLPAAADGRGLAWDHISDLASGS